MNDREKAWIKEAGLAAQEGTRVTSKEQAPITTEFIRNRGMTVTAIDRGTMDSYGWSLELDETIGKGDDKCTIRMRKNV